jgi:hypothetical protein
MRGGLMPARRTTPSATGYSGTPLVKKLGIKEEMAIVALHAPDHFEELIGPLPMGATLRHTLRSGQRCDMLIGFVTERAHLARTLPRLLGALPPDGALWVAWPKKASGVATDLSDGVVRDVVLPTGWVDTKVCAIDETWSGLKLVLRKVLRPGRSRT